MRVPNALAVLLLGLVLQPGLAAAWPLADPGRAAPDAPRPAARPRVSVQAEHGRLTVSAEGASLREVLEAIARQTGIEFVVSGATDQPVTLGSRVAQNQRRSQDFST